MHKKVDFKEISVHEGPKQSPGFLLWHISTSWRSSIEAVLKPIGLTHPQFVVLATLGWLTKNGESITQVSIGRMAGLDPNTTSQIVKGLEQKGLIRREASSDSRAKNCNLTSIGHKILGKAMPEVETADEAFFNSFTKREMETTIKLFQKLVPV